MKKILGILGIAIIGGIIALGGYKLFIEKPQIIIERTTNDSLQKENTNYTATNISPNASTSFTEAAAKTINAVVHVKNTAIKTQVNPWAELYYGQGNGTKKYAQVGTGSGVIISSDGLIITNNHVIDGATELEITLNNKEKYPAELIGTDPDNDIALLKINAKTELPYIPYANSDNVKVGEWVLAVGNPYNLTSTVTAGIVSAKGRDLEGNGKVESFIQTDAAVNSGNSGGALVNIRGELIGINTAISSRTGSFIGYSFAVPSNIAKKVIEDILEYGSVQEAIIGISYSPNKDATTNGVKIVDLPENGGAKKAGLRTNDIIIKINNIKITKFSELKGQLTEKRPGDIVQITVLRDGNEITKNVALTKRYLYTLKGLKIDVKNISKSDKKKLGVDSGAKIVNINNKDLEYYGVKKGYIIIKINKELVKNAKSAQKLIKKYYGKTIISLEIMNLKGQIERYRFR